VMGMIEASTTPSLAITHTEARGSQHE
jgi:hypothetical protein